MTPETLYQVACEQITAGAIEQAIKSFETLLQMPDLPSTPTAFFLDIENFLSNLEPNQPQQWSNTIADTARLKLAQLYWQSQQANAAFQTLEPLLASGNISLYQIKARWLIHLGELDSATQTLNLILSQDPHCQSAYEDLALIANLQKRSQSVLEIIERVLPNPLSPRLFEELLWAAAHSSEIAIRPLFIELCIQNIQIDTYPLLVELLQTLYLAEDFEHAAYLGWHLWQQFPDPEIMNILVLSSLKQGKPSLALQVLRQAPQILFQQGTHWYKLGIAYQAWQMPHFAQQAFAQAQQLSPELEPEIRQHIQQEALPDPANEILKMMLLDPDWARQLRQEPAAVLAKIKIPLSSALLHLIESLPASETGQSELKFPDLASETT